MDNKIHSVSGLSFPIRCAESASRLWWDVLEAAFNVCVATAHPANFMASHIKELPDAERIICVGAGKASAAMAAALELHLGPSVTGVVLTRYDHGAPTNTIDIIEAGHPVPDAKGFAGTRRIIEILQSARPDDLILGLFSGGGSSLLCAPIAPLSLADKQAINEELLNSGLPISAMNCIRKHLSRVKGGKLPTFAPGVRMVNFLMSDVPHDDLSAIASGPTVGCDDEPDIALKLARDARLQLPKVAWNILQDSSHASLRTAAPALAHVENRLVASPAQALAAACAALTSMGIEPIFLGANLEGEASELGREHAALALAKAPVNHPVCIVSGGETTVTIKAKGGCGGRNTEYLLGLALGLNGAADIVAMAADTDGIDGKGSHAGAFIDPGFLRSLTQQGLNPLRMLVEHKSLNAFDAYRSTFSPGPTQTNVNDFRAILLLPRGTLA